ncbi:glycosyltransferase [Dysgonomonas sp. 520]|uniref:CgeB family protein n=1 Tax=Dysgonomonas sp. 520 TaxID=2302931 RepID=UPI0013D4CA02|nr:glycosyltransferase [Dysgonomonas sp. 520]NDW09008.1 hypothetical protein [Dysgonomonas sp. 520]
MRIAIIGANNYDTLEYNLKDAFAHNNYHCEIFDINNSKIFKNKIISKYTLQLDMQGRGFFDSYDQWIFDKVFRRVAEYQPDLVICTYRFIHPKFVSRVKKELKCKIVHVNPDALTTFGHQQVFASDYDVWFSKDPYIVSFMKGNLHLNAKYYSEAFNSRIHKRMEVDKKTLEDELNIDVVTYGNIYPYRSRMLKILLDNNINLKLYGVKSKRFYDNALDKAYQNKCILGEEKAKILYGSKIVFNQMHYAEIGSVNNRFFEANGSGAFQLSDYRPILKDLLPIDPELVSFRTIDEGIEKIKYYLEHTDERIEIAGKVHNHFIQNYTYDHLIEFILKSI